MKSLKVALLTLVITASGCAEAADEKIVADAKSNDATQANATQANSSQNKGTLAAQIEAQLSKVFGSRAVVSDVTPFANGSILEVTMADGGMLHVLPDLEHFIYQNTLYQITNEGLKNISDTRMNANRAQAMASIKDS
ncbi:MAG: hypothetical protein P1U57_06775, partial [Oleibacter sp.]|nr:hypothetical protein [Thalassolituus sp.]